MTNQLISTETLYDFMAESIKNKKPSSFIRMGDGENIILGFESISSAQEIKWMLHKIFGPYPFTREQIIFLRDSLINACHGANIIGIPPPSHRKLDRRFCWWDDVLVEKYDLYKNNCEIASSEFHLDFQKKHVYKRLLEHTDKIYCISGRDVKSAIENNFNVECELIRITPQFSDSNYKVNNHPDLYSGIVSSIKNKAKDNLWFVGAGFYGKSYCNEIKKHGGIAIDIGSVLDAWLGIKSRGCWKDEDKII